MSIPPTFQKAGDHFDPYASEADTEELLRIGKMPEALRLADMLEREMQHPGHGRAADCLRNLHAELEAIKQAITDPENQPSQFGTVTMAHMQREVEAECVICVKDKQDAERYRHMRNNAHFQSRNGPGLYWYLPRFSDGKVRDEGEQLDEAIDAAIRARGQQ